MHREAVENYVDGLNFRRTGRLLKVSHTSVMNWVKAHAEELPEQAPVPAEPPEVCELDELFSFVGTKKTKSIS